jgi:hypothetical protein
MDEDNEYDDPDYQEEPSYHSYNYNHPKSNDDWYERDELED